jgi:hypothetical protein
MRRFDLLDEYTSVAVPKFSSPRAQPPRRDAEDRRAKGNWRYGVAGVLVVLLVALAAL